MLRDQTKKIINKIAIIGMVLFFLLALLLPQPYVKGRAVVFEENGKLNTAALVLFELLMISLWALSLTLFYFTRIITIEDVKNSIIYWSRESNLAPIHTILNPLPEFIVEAKTLNDKERVKKQREQIEMLKGLWEQEKNLAHEQDDEIEKLQKELDELRLRELKLKEKELEEIKKHQIKNQSKKNQNIKKIIFNENEIINEDYSDIFG